VTEVVRGADLFNQTAVQVTLWDALGAVPPTWLHGPIILGPDGRKLSKSHRSAHIGDLRGAGWAPADIWRVVLPWLGLSPVSCIGDAVSLFDPARMAHGPIVWAPPASVQG